MTTTALPTTGLDVIEALDFDPDLCCEEVVWHTAGPATHYVLSHCQTFALCERCISKYLAWFRSHRIVNCSTCGAGPVDGAAVFRILGPVRTH